jgi:hypothetical protein
VRPKIAIGITTYLDISDRELGAAVYNAHEETSERLTPNKIRIWSAKHDVNTADDFGSLWLTVMPFERREGKGPDKGKLLEKGEFRVGAEWSRTGALAGRGRVNFRPEMEQSQCDTLSIEFNYDPKIDWYGLFERLVEVCKPAYGMLHLFTEAELSLSAGKDHLERFDGPLVGEGSFTSWKTSEGTWRGPDKWQLAERRTYRFLPQLSWANYFGSEFDGEVDAMRRKAVTEATQGTENGRFLSITESISDVLGSPVFFDAKREELKSQFPGGFFRW